MKICDISFLYFPRGGGIKTYIDIKRKEYAKLGIQHFVIAPSVKNISEIKKEENGNLAIYFIPSRHIAAGGVDYYLFKRFSDIEKVLQEEKPDVIEIGDKLTPLLFYKKLKNYKKRSSAKIFVFSHERADNFIALSLNVLKKQGILYALKFRIFWSLQDAVMKRFAGVADEIIANSDFTAEELLPYAKGKKVHVLDLGIEDEEGGGAAKELEHLKNQLTENGKKKVLIHVGRLDKEKKIELLERIAEKINPERYVLVVVGGGRDEKYLRTLPTVRLTGYISREEVKKYLSVADLGVLINDVEPFGLVAIEMMAYGIPILGPFEGGLAQILKRTFAWKLPHEADAYIHALEEWERITDKESLKKNAREEFLSRYTSAHMVKKLLEIYNSAE